MAILEQYGPSNVLVEKYLQGYHGLVKTLVDNIYYYQDELGSTSHVANATEALLEYYKYDLYGKPTYWTATTPSSQLQASAYGVRDLHGGARWMPEIGLYDDRNRFMSPDLGRFLQPDPIGFKGDASNLYRYCGNDWANRTDPMGLAADTQLAKDPVFQQMQELLKAKSWLWKGPNPGSTVFGRSALESLGQSFGLRGNQNLSFGQASAQQQGGVPAKYGPALDKQGNQKVIDYTPTQKGPQWQLEDSKGNPFKAGNLKNEETLVSTNAPGDVRTKSNQKLSTQGIMTDVVGPIKKYGPQTNRSIENVFKNRVIWDSQSYPISTEFKQQIVIQHGVATKIESRAIEPGDPGYVQ